MTALSRAELVAIFRRLADAIEGDKPEAAPIMRIAEVQTVFNSIRAANYPKLVVDDVKGPVTTFALQELQATAGLPVTGEIDEATISLLRNYK